MTTDDERSVTTDAATAQQQPDPAGVPASPPPRRLVRLDQGAPFAGVAAGLGAYFGVDPVLVRIAFVALAFAGGIGLVLYVACWIAMPAGSPTDVRGAPPAERTGQWIAIGLLALVGLVLFTQMPFWTPWPVNQALLTALVLIVLGVVLFRWDASRRESAARATPPTAPSPVGATLPAAPPYAAGTGPPGAVSTGPPGAGMASPGAGMASPGGGTASPGAGTASPGGSTASPGAGTASPGGGTAPPGAAPPGAGPPPGAAPPDYAPEPSAAEPKEPPSVLGRLAAGAGLLVLGVAALLDNAGALRLGAHHYVALALTVTGLALLVGAWWGRARGLIAVGILLVLLLAVTSAFGALSGSSAEVGERFYAPATAAEAAEPFRLLAGELHVDLTALEETPAVIDVAVVAGDLLVVVPDDVNVVVESSVGAGELELPDRVIGGLNVRRTASFDADPGSATHEIEARAGFGRVRVLRAEALGPTERFLP